MSSTLLCAPGSAAEGVAADWWCPTCGADVRGACSVLTAGCRIDAELVTCRLEQAGEALLAMRGTRPGPALVRSCMPAVVQETMDAYGYTEAEARPAVPSAAEISRMDAAYEWLSLIPAHRRVLRRIVAVRSLVDPLTGRHKVSWRRLGRLVGADHKAVERWHGWGITIITDQLRSIL